ncbi:MAG: flagellar export protein FliJ [Aestuariivirga sp.]|jgi:flagellar protein FliJ
MRSRETLLRLHRFRTEDRRRQAADIDGMIQDLTKKYDELDSHVRFEESRNGVTDPANVNYSMAAKATRGRRDNLLKSISDLKDQKAAVLAQLADEEVELRKVEMLMEKESGTSSSASASAGLVAAHAH